MSEIEDRIARLERDIARLKADRSVGSAFDGSLSLKWKQRVQGPNGTAYILIREAGGNAAFADASTAVDADWSDA